MEIRVLSLLQEVDYSQQCEKYDQELSDENEIEYNCAEMSKSSATSGLHHSSPLVFFWLHWSPRAGIASILVVNNAKSTSTT